MELKNINGFTPFFESVWRNKYEVSKYLIDMGSNVSVQSNAGHTALYIATVRAQKEYLNLLVATGCNLQKETWLKQRHLPVALSEHRELCDWLLECVRGPPPLQSLCCWATRKYLTRHIANKSKLLPIPAKLQDFVALKDVLSP